MTNSLRSRSINIVQERIMYRFRDLEQIFLALSWSTLFEFLDQLTTNVLALLSIRSLRSCNSCGHCRRMPFFWSCDKKETKHSIKYKQCCVWLEELFWTALTQTGRQLVSYRFFSLSMPSSCIYLEYHLN